MAIKEKEKKELEEMRKKEEKRTIKYIHGYSNLHILALIRSF